MLTDELVMKEDPRPMQATSVDVDLKTFPGAALARLIEEVRNEQVDAMRAYDRAHNRHNR